MAGIITIVGTIVALTGCQAPGNYMGDEGVKVNTDNAEQLASDLVPLLHGPFNPATTTFVIPASIAHKPVGTALEAELRRAGYAVTNDQKRPDAIHVGYELDRFEGGTIRVSIVAGEKFQASRLYDEEEDGTLEPENTVTVWREGPPPPRRVRRHKLLAQAVGVADPAPSSAAPATQPPAAVAPSTPQPPPAATHAAPAAAAQPPAIPPSAAAPTSEAPDAKPADEKPKVTVAAPAPKTEEDDDDPKPDESEIFDVAVNSDNVAEITPALYSAVDSAVPNPFVELYRPTSLSHEATIRVSTIAMGPRPTAVINDRQFGVGDKIEGFRIDAIRADSVQLRKGYIRITIKMQEEPVKIRMP